MRLGFLYAVCIAFVSSVVQWTDGLSLSDRRRLLRGLGIASVGGSVKSQTAAASQQQSPIIQVYKVHPDASASLDPSLTRLDERTFFGEVLSKSGALWLGEHHNSLKDHALQVRVLCEAARRRNGKPTALGLEQVQVQFQPILDSYINGDLTVTELKSQTDWDRRWIWPFDLYEPILETARDLGMTLVALNVDSEDLVLVEKNGLPGLPRDRLSRYIVDAPGFAEFARARRFGAYVDYVIQPSYELHRAMGLLRRTVFGEKLDEEMPFRNFLSSRILWDEAMALRAYEWTKNNPMGLLIGLVGADHVKFSDGIPGRFARMAGSENLCTSVLLNPTLIDTRPAGSVDLTNSADSSRNLDSITLQLRYLKDNVDVFSPDRSSPESTGGVLPLADYLVTG